MKILCLHRELLQPGGSETLFKAITDELINLEHEVSIFTLKKGPWAKYFNKKCVFIDLKQTGRTRSFDAIISMHRPMAQFATRFNCHKTMICNGPIPIELAIAGFDRYVSVSPEVQAANRNLGFSSDILYNGINLHEFCSNIRISKKLKHVLMITNHCPGTINIVSDACKLKNLFFKHIGGIQWTPFVANAINQADLVVSLGRGVYEAMACGRNVIIFDYRGGDGFLTYAGYYRFRTNNCSGRVINQKFSVKQLSNLFDYYDYELSNQFIELARQHHNIEDFVRELLMPVTYKVEPELNVNNL